MNQGLHNKIVSFIWGIADDVLRDLFKRGKYPDVILPMCVIRRLDAVLEPTKLTNPPFNDSDWRGELLRDDRRRAHGTPPAGCRPPHTEQRTGSPTS